MVAERVFDPAKEFFAQMPPVIQAGEDVRAAHSIQLSITSA